MPINTGPGIKHNTLQSYRAKGPGGSSSSKLNSNKAQEVQDKIKAANKTVQKQKVEISNKAKELASGAKDFAKNHNVAVNAATSVASNLGTSALKAAITGTGSSDNKDEKLIPPPDKASENKAEETKLAEKINSKTKKGTLKKPGIFFITGFESLSLSTDYDGVRKMAEAVEGSRVYSWDQKDEIIEEIQKRKANMPIIMVGHSYGADTAVEVANELNTLENGFRNVNLLVTIDSVGSNNDIIPQNVEKNLNIFGENDWFLNDEPNVARNNEITTVINELRSEGHRELDNSNDIQYKIMKEVNGILG